MSGGTDGRTDGGRSFGRAYMSYLALRLVLFGIALVVFMLVGLSGLLAAALALLASGLASYPLARRQRQAIVDAYKERRDRGPQ